jgi:hypothetical protein
VANDPGANGVASGDGACGRHDAATVPAFPVSQPCRRAWEAGGRP